MEYFRSLGTSLLQQSGVVLPFALGERVAAFDREGTIWALYDAVKRDDNSLISVFVFEAATPYAGRPDRRTFLPIARNALKKLRSTRHPDVLKFIDAHETESVIYIATERVKPLCAVLSADVAKPLGEDSILWGLHCVATALSFLNTQALSIHGLVRPSSIFVTESGEWRLGGLDLLSSTRPGPDLEQGVLWTLAGLVAGKDEVSPEVRKGGWSCLKESDPSAHDAYTLALLIHSLFNPTHPPPPTSLPPHPAPQPSSRGAIPAALFPAFKRMLNPNPKTRLTAEGLLNEGGRPEEGRKGFFGGNRFLWIVQGLDGWALKGESERSDLLKAIQSPTSPLPPAFLTHKVLPSLLHSLSLPSTSSTSASALLPLVLSLGKLVPPADYTKLVLEPVVKLYQSPDRGTRMALLEGLGEYESKMDNRCVQEKVWPHLITGFADTVPVIREATLKAIPVIAPKLSDRLLNNDLLRLLAKTQTDPEPSIRTNTCILLGRLTKLLGPNTKRKVLVPAFARALKDSFVHARVAGLMALMATVDVYERDDLALRVVPVVSGALVDKEKLVRDQAFIAIGIFLKRIEALIASMPESAEPNGAQPSMDLTNNSSPSAPTTQTQAQQATRSAAGGAGGLTSVAIASTASGAAGALAGWAFSSLSKQLATADLQTTLTDQPAIPGAFGAAPSSSKPPVPPASTRPSAASSTMKLAGGTLNLGGGGSKSKYDVAAVLGDDADDDLADAWGSSGSKGNGDLIDVDADADDWGGFEEAPTPLYPPPPPPPPPPQEDHDRLYGAAPVARPQLAAASSFSSPRTTTSKALQVPTPAPPAAAKQLRSTPSAANRSSTSGTPPTSRSASPALVSVQKVGSVQEPAPVVSLEGLSKEEKDREMARRREERKARIAGLKKAGGAK